MKKYYIRARYSHGAFNLKCLGYWLLCERKWFLGFIPYLSTVEEFPQVEPEQDLDMGLDAVKKRAEELGGYIV